MVHGNWWPCAEYKWGLITCPISLKIFDKKGLIVSLSADAIDKVGVLKMEVFILRIIGLKM